MQSILLKTIKELIIQPSIELQILCWFFHKNCWLNVCNVEHNKLKTT